MNSTKPKITVDKWREKQHDIVGTIIGSVWNFVMIPFQVLGHLFRNLVNSLNKLAGLSLMGIGFICGVESYSHLLGKGSFLNQLQGGWGAIGGIGLTLGLTLIVQAIQWEGAVQRNIKKNLGDIDNIKADQKLIVAGYIAYFIEGMVAISTIRPFNSPFQFLVKLAVAIIMVIGVEWGYSLFTSKK